MKAIAKDAEWEAEGAQCARIMNAWGTPAYRIQQIERSLKAYEARNDRQANAWKRGYRGWLACHA